ncbi:hypothetical protein [Shewanella algae]|uniref:hypothetical protein n=1 Tax=Shewanella algae TaxID=38313 RepID=UPI001AAC5D71|nr:hypothetical protein [Shewanella algae]MBO2578811.1 hypothetical protein [Shewanella algae]MBO2684286.1 hypothetical protein [Shewanella algae]BCV62016.1 hypothetical protein TUM17386_16870 [Shewanella algae]
MRQHVFAPLINYFQEEKARTAVSNKEINQATGTQMASHWFTASQWQLPNAEQYQKLQALFTKKGTMARWRLSSWRCSDNTKVWHKSLMS